ncbi:Unknown protein [Striga hermonthica]|uniref:Uncharacterized protein n=1 Tax=Striga hermonthica TaxID=68872 RepID=A0A9N7NWS0_STRHE|nr:Unknown protein [Striga hermonthica]
MTLPPKISEQPQTSLSARSSASMASLLAIGASSQTISTLSRIKDPKLLCLLILQDLTFDKSIGILNLECAVLPPGNMDAAIPDVAVARPTQPFDRTTASKAR